MKLKDWLSFFADKRFGVRFKLANLIMNDCLRNYLAVDMIPLKNAEKWCEKHPDMAKKEIEKVQADILELFSMGVGSSMSKKKYQICKTCWVVEFGQRRSYRKTDAWLYPTYAEAVAEIYRNAIDELNMLNCPCDPLAENTGHFRIELDDEEYLAIIRLWDSTEEVVEGGNDYWNVTGYNIVEVNTQDKIRGDLSV